VLIVFHYSYTVYLHFKLYGCYLCSQFSDHVTYTCSAAPPEAPPTPKYIDPGVDHVTINWSSPDNNGGNYKIDLLHNVTFDHFNQVPGCGLLKVLCEPIYVSYLHSSLSVHTHRSKILSGLNSLYVRTRSLY